MAGAAAAGARKAAPFRGAGAGRGCGARRDPRRQSRQGGKVAAILERRDNARIEETHVRAYLAAGDPATPAVRNRLDLPCPSAQRLKSLLDDPTIRAAPPPDLMPVQRVHPLVDAVKTDLPAGWWTFGAFGLLFRTLAIRQEPGPGPRRTPERIAVSPARAGAMERSNRVSRLALTLSIT